MSGEHPRRHRVDAMTVNRTLARETPGEQGGIEKVKVSERPSFIREDAPD